MSAGLPDKQAAAGAIDAFLRALGRDPSEERELEGTGLRVADAFIDELCAGYAVDLPRLLANHVLPLSAASPPPEFVVVRDVVVTTTCPHHLMPATGHGLVAFAPREALVGIGALAALLDAAARRLTLQEEIGSRVVSALLTSLRPAWAACRLVLTHTCMTARGERRHGAKVDTFTFDGERSHRAEAHRLLFDTAGARGVL